MKHLDNIILDLNRRQDSMLISTCLAALDKVKAMQTAENEHETQLAEIEAQRPVVIQSPHEPQKTLITYTEQDGLRIERPHRQEFTIGQRFMFATIKWIAVILLSAVLLVRGLAV